MTYAQYFKTSSYCLIIAGFAAIAVTGCIALLPIFLYSSIIVISWFIDTGRLRRNIPVWIVNSVVLACIPVFWIDYKYISLSFVITTIHFLLFTAAIKLLTLERDSDYLYLYLISLAELLTASTLAAGIAFFLCFVFFLLSSVSTMILFEMRRSNAVSRSKGGVQPFVVSERLQGTGLELFSRFPAGFISAMVLGMTLLILASALPLFFLLPRFSTHFRHKPSGAARFVSGFSEKVELGQIGTIKQSDTLVMRVKLNAGPSGLPANLKWRGIAFDYFDGRSWKRSDTNRQTVPAQGRYFKLEESTQGINLLVQTYFLEALSTDVVFAAHKVLALSNDLEFLQNDTSGNLYTAQHQLRKTRYIAISDPVRPDSASVVDSEDIAQEISDVYLQLPPLDPRIADLAKEITKSAPTTYKKAQVLEEYLRTHYGYSLKLQSSPNSRDPLAMFLFDVRKGHCEYFASAMTIMLRHLEIPARLVNGFRAGEYNKIGGNWIVRQYDAHSWVEAYFPSHGWIEFDPTPAEFRNPRSALSLFLGNLSDAVDLWWWDSIVNYDFRKQSQLTRVIRSEIADIQNNTGDILSHTYERVQRGTSTLISLHFSDWLHLIWIPALIAILLFLVGFRRRQIVRWFRPLFYRNNPAAMVVGFYSDALELLGAHGWKRSQGQTPLEFAGTLGDHPAAPPFAALTHLYYQIRFGHADAELNLSEVEGHLHSLRQALN
jgi:transglutaminase-like putative cysteine protease